MPRHGRRFRCYVRLRERTIAGTRIARKVWPEKSSGGRDPLTPTTFVLLNETANAAGTGFEDGEVPARLDGKARRDRRVRGLCAFAAGLPRRIHAGRRLRLPGRH